MPSGAPAILAEPVSWWNTQWAQQIRESIAPLRPARRPRPPPPRSPQDEPVDNDEPEPRGRRESARCRRRRRSSSRPIAACSSRTRPLTRGARPPCVADRLAEQDLEQLAAPRARAAARSTSPTRPAPTSPTLAEWIEQWLFPVYRRSVRGHDRVWCPQWWRHAEAVARLDALWRAWEHLRLGCRHRPVGLVSRPRRPPHDDSHGRRRAVQRLRRHALRPARGAASVHAAARGDVRARRRPHTHRTRQYLSCPPHRPCPRCRPQLDDPASSMNQPPPHSLEPA